MAVAAGAEALGIAGDVAGGRELIDPGAGVYAFPVVSGVVRGATSPAAVPVVSPEAAAIGLTGSPDRRATKIPSVPSTATTAIPVASRAL
jgi:hypothetical protein